MFKNKFFKSFKIKRHKKRINNHSKATDEYKVTRLSIPGNYCVHCDTKMNQSIKCPDCGIIDPLTKSDMS